MTVTDEELMAYVDGELDAARCEALRQEIAASADLSRRVAEQQALRDRLSRAFDPALDEPVPSRLTDLASRARVVDFASAARQRPSRNVWLSGLALAAGIILGIALGPAVLQLATERPDIVASGSDVSADGALADALSRRLASEQYASDPIRLGVSFRATNGEYCRTFISRRSDGALAGMACRQGPWTLSVRHRPVTRTGRRLQSPLRRLTRQRIARKRDARQCCSNTRVPPCVS